MSLRCYYFFGYPNSHCFFFVEFSVDDSPPDFHPGGQMILTSGTQANMSAIIPIVMMMWIESADMTSSCASGRG
jgi:hypothetical protein